MISANSLQHELYVWPFAEAVRAGTGSIMCSYNQINNSYACQNSHLQNYILKNELGFQGFIMSDWSAQVCNLILLILQKARLTHSSTLA